MKLNKADLKLIEVAKKTAMKFTNNRWGKKKISTVGAALRTEKEEIFSAPNIFHPFSGPSSVCAEPLVIGKAYSEGMKKIDTIVAYHFRSKTNQGFYPPCGQCREFMRLFGNPWVILSHSKKERLSHLLPFE